MRWTAGLVLLLLAGAAGAGEVVVSATVPWEDKDGYTPVLVRAESLVGAVELRLRASIDNVSTVATLRVEPGRARLLTLLIPAHSGWGGVKLAWSGAGGGDLGCSTTIDYRAADLIALDPGEAVPVPALAKLLTDRIPEAADIRGGYHRGGNERVRRLPADALPDRWQGWPAWLTLITTAQGDAQLAPAQREAIIAWTRAGGALFTTSAGQQEVWRKAGARVGLYDPAAGEPLALLARLRLAAGEEGRPTAAPVPGTEHLPTGWFLTLAIAFAVLAGPVNLWWVRRQGRPHLLLITTPLLSAGTCLLLIVVTLAADGIGRRRTAAQVVVLDAASQRCVGFSAVTFFCAIAPGGFALDPEDRLTPMDETDFRGGWGKERPQLAIDYGDAVWADDGWIPARVNRQLAWTQVRPERRRLSVRREGAAWRIGNGLGVAVTALLWIDPQGHAFSSGRIEAGADCLAQPAPTAPPETAPGAALRRLGTDARLALAGLGQDPGTFTCRLAAPLLAIPGPSAEDAAPVEAWAAGWLAPERLESR